MWVAVLLGKEKGWSRVIQASDAVGQGSILTWDGKAASLQSAFAVSAGLDPMVSTELSLEVVPRLWG